MTDKQFSEIMRLMKPAGRKSYGALVRRVLGPLDRDPTDLEAGQIITFLRKEAYGIRA